MSTCSMSRKTENNLKFDQGAKNGFRTNPRGNNFPGSINKRTNNIINFGFKQDRFGDKQNFGNNSNYRGSERRDGKSFNNSRAN